MRLSLTVNGEHADVEARPDDMLIDVLRRLGVASVRETCGIGVCGACTVLVDNADGRQVTTVEGLGGTHPVQLAFAEAHAFQCGYCTPGMVLTAARLLQENAQPSEEQIRLALAGNLCRCGCYVKIVEAVLLASGRREEAWTS